MPKKALTEVEKSLAEKWKECLSLLDNWVQSGLEALLRAVKYGAMDRIIITAGRDARLSGYDEKVFARYEQLMRLYEKASSFYESNCVYLHTVSLSTIMRRINGILREQITDFNTSWDGQSENPIASEKIQIISGSVASFSMSFEEREKEYRQNVLCYDCALLKKELLAQDSTEDVLSWFPFFMEAAESRLEAFFLGKSYELHCQAVQTCLFDLNNLHNRGVMNHYYHLLTRQQDLLSAAIQLQINALEQEVLRYAGNSQEQYMAHVFLSYLRECYQFYAEKASEAVHAFEEAQNGNDPSVLENPEEYQRSWQDMFANGGILVQKDYQEETRRYEACLAEMSDLLRENIHLLWGNIVPSPRERIDELFREAGAESTLAEELIGIFGQMVSFYRENEPLYTFPAENEILKGINETLLIKMESLEENKTAFGQKIESIMEKFPQADSGPPAEEMTPVLLNAWKRTFDCLPGGEGQLAALFRLFYQNASEVRELREYRRRKEDAGSRLAEKVRHTILGLKKDVILYEISTYEEILAYSVSRLRHSGQEAVKDYVEMVDEGMLKIESLLQKNNITVIKPNPHEMFNGKEHEVLMAEKNEEFEKGQIIKRMTSGYRQDDRILLRANVIAAR